MDPWGLDIPKGKRSSRTVYRFEMPERISTTWQAHEWNVGSDHRYTKPGVGGVYGANSSKTALAEVTHYGLADDVTSGKRILVSERFELKNVLDLTDSKVRAQLGIELSDLTGGDYTTTHKWGDWAKANGYDGILAPSARNETGSNLISFEGKYK